jgi:hypothetical protein
MFFVYLLVYLLVCYLIGMIFHDREGGLIRIFLFSLFLSPIIGVFVGITSKKLTHKEAGSFFQYRPEVQLAKKKEKIYNRLEELTKLEKVGLLSDSEKKEIDELREDYKSI